MVEDVVVRDCLAMFPGVNDVRRGVMGLVGVGVLRKTRAGGKELTEGMVGSFLNFTICNTKKNEASRCRGDSKTGTCFCIVYRSIE